MLKDATRKGADICVAREAGEGAAVAVGPLTTRAPEARTTPVSSATARRPPWMRARARRNAPFIVDLPLTWSDAARGGLRRTTVSPTRTIGPGPRGPLGFRRRSRCPGAWI